MLHQQSQNANSRSRDGYGFGRSLLRGCLSLGVWGIAVAWILIGSSTRAEERLPVLAPPLNAVLVNKVPMNKVPKNAVPPSAPSVSPFAITPDQAKASIQWLTELAIQRMPQRYEGDKNWGKQKEIWSGVKVRFDGGKLKRKRRHREVKQGRWIQYRIELPVNRSIESSIEQVEQIAASASQPNSKLRIRSTTIAPMKFTARVQRWNLGVRLYSVTVEGRMEVEFKTKSTLEIAADYGEVPPAIVVSPRIETASLRLARFEVDRVSHLGGDAAEAWGEVLQEVIVERFVARRGDRLAEKLNRSIDKHRDDLRISFADWIARKTGG